MPEIHVHFSPSQSHPPPHPQMSSPTSSADVAVTVNDPKAEPLLSESSAPSEPSEFVEFLKSIPYMPLKLVGLTIIFTFELVLHILTFQWLRAIIFFFKTMGKRSVPVPEGEGVHHRWSPVSQAKGELVSTPFDGTTTMYDLSKRAFGLYAENRCMGVRTYLGPLQEDVDAGKKAIRKEFGETKVRSHQRSERKRER